MVKPIWKFMLVAVAGWMNRQQQEAIEYLKEENRILREKLGQKRIRLNESQKQRLSAAAAKLGRALLAQIGSLFSPDTLLRWNRWFIARKYDGSDRRGKRGSEPKKANSIRKLVIQMATDNASWGYGHITGELKGLAVPRTTTNPDVSDVVTTTVARMTRRPIFAAPAVFLSAAVEDLGRCE